MTVKLEIKIAVHDLRKLLKSGLLFDMASNSTSAFPEDAKLVGVQFDVASDSIAATFAREVHATQDEQASYEKRFLVFKTYPFEGLTRINKAKEEPPQPGHFAAIWCENGRRLARYCGENVWKAENGAAYCDVQVYLPMPVLPDEFFSTGCNTVKPTTVRLKDG